MNLHEYQAKAILKKHNVTIPVGFFCDKAEDAKLLAEKIKAETGSDVFAVKFKFMQVAEAKEEV
ncbi:MAG TPA: hypothetical protein PKG63_00660 [Bacteroidales bacterium]|nr:hypothetical protein [Bacteroidales bacterium]